MIPMKYSCIEVGGGRIRRRGQRWANVRDWAGQQGEEKEDQTVQKLDFLDLLLGRRGAGDEGRVIDSFNEEQ